MNVTKPTRVTVDAVGNDRAKPVPFDVVADRIVKKYDLSRDDRISVEEAIVTRFVDEHVDGSYTPGFRGTARIVYDRYKIDETLTLLNAANTNRDVFTTREELTSFFRNQAGAGATAIDFKIAQAIDNAHESSFSARTFVKRIAETFRY